MATASLILHCLFPFTIAGLAETLCGSPLYMAPEILQFHKYDAKADLWSVGAIMFEMLAGHTPFNGRNHVELLRNIERHDAQLPVAAAARASSPCKQLLSECQAFSSLLPVSSCSLSY